ncbi:MAG: PilZ domain-containing protein [Oligoflexia bacterium]|nr:PilZ domain-containing protein [Oligoflexia bacterium]
MSQGTGNKEAQSQIIDFRQIREQKLEEKRRTTERIFFKHLLSVYSVVGDSSMCPIEFIDISEKGCSFQVPYDPDRPWPTDAKDLPLRIYFSQDTFLEIRVKVQNSNPSIEGNRRYVRFGCSIDTSVSSYEAYLQFVRFLRAYSEHSHKDTGDVSVFYL